MLVWKLRRGGLACQWFWQVFYGAWYFAITSFGKARGNRIDIKTVATRAYFSWVMGTFFERLSPVGSAISAHLQRGRNERSRVSETGSEDNVAAWLYVYPLSAKSGLMRRPCARSPTWTKRLLPRAHRCRTGAAFAHCVQRPAYEKNASTKCKPAPC